MSLSEKYFAYLDHLGRTVPVRDLAAGATQTSMVALRHDIDHDLDLALEMAHHEHRRGFRATYYLLHTAPYWQDEHFLLKCRQLEAYGHEVGLHLNVLVEWAAGATDSPGSRLNEILGALRAAGVRITGFSAHGDKLCYSRQFINYWCFRELRPPAPLASEDGRNAEGLREQDAARRIAYPPDHTLKRDDGSIFHLWSVSMKEAGIDYCATHVPSDGYWSDSGGVWQSGADPLAADLSKGRHQVLIHPEWWRGRQRFFFALSTARSGSKWLANFVDRATPCRGLHEWMLNHRRDGGAVVEDKHTADYYPQLLGARRDSARKLIQEGGRIAADELRDRFEANVYLEPFIEEIREVLPDAVFIHLHRDGRDVVRSLMNRGWYDTPFDHRHPAAPVDGWDQLSQFEKCCWYYRYTQERLLSANMERVQFARMVKDLGYISARLEALGIPVHPLLAAEEHGKQVNASTNSEFPAHDAWTADQVKAFWQTCGGVHEALGHALEGLPDGKARPPVLSSRWKQPRRPGLDGTAFSCVRLDCAQVSPKTFSAKNLLMDRGEKGLGLRVADPSVANAHLLLHRGEWTLMKLASRLIGQGEWRFMKLLDGYPTARDRYHVCRIEAEMPDRMIARVFCLSFASEGHLIDKRAVVTLRQRCLPAEFAFRPAAEASHFTLAIHLARQSPDDIMWLRTLAMSSIPILSEDVVEEDPKAES